MGVGIVTHLTKHDSTYHQSIDDIRLTIMKDGHSEKLELKASSTDVAGGPSAKFDDFTDMHDTSFSGTKFIGLGGRMNTVDGSHPDTSSAKLKAK